MSRSYATSNTAIFCGLNPGSPHHAGILASLASGVSRENLYLVHSVSECIFTGRVVSRLHPSVPVLTSGLQRVYEFLRRRCCRPHSITPFFNLLLCQVSTLISYPSYTWRSSRYLFVIVVLLGSLARFLRCLREKYYDGTYGITYVSIYLRSVDE